MNTGQRQQDQVAAGGQRGPQIEVILPGRFRINTELFRVEIQPATIVQANQVGLVTAKDGEPLPARELVAAGVRGHAAVDLAALEEALLRLNQLLTACPEIAEFDLNPYFAAAPGAPAGFADARLTLRG